MADAEGMEWVSVRVAAEQLETTLVAVYSMVHHKQLRKRKVANRLFVAVEDVETLRQERKQGRQKGEGWISLAQAGRMLGCSARELRSKVCYKGMTKARVWRRNFVLLAEVEALLRDPKRVRQQANWERQMGKRRVLEGKPYDAVDVKRAALIVGTAIANIQSAVARGRLSSFQEKVGGSKHWLRRSEVEAWRDELAAKRAERERRNAEPVFPTRKCSRVRLRPRLSQSGPIDVGDLSEWEKYMGDWLTTRQTAWQLHVTKAAIYAMRMRGRLEGRKLPTLMTNQMQWHYRKADVLRLRGEDEYVRRHQQYMRYGSPEGKARRAAEQEAALARERAIAWEVSERMHREHSPLYNDAEFREMRKMMRNQTW